MNKKLQGLTILELIIVMVIIGILAALGLANFAGPKEQVLEREAQANLKLISSAEKIYRMEIGGYVNCTNTSNVNALLRLMVSPSDTNWRYKVKDADAIAFSAVANRTSGPYSGTKLFCIDQVLDNATNSSCSW
jgi:prepilin-type N-terminal cleavage/methylation domain-containing protein